MKKNHDGRTPQRIKQKLFFILFLILAAFVLLLGRLLYWNLSKGHEFEKRVLIQQRHSSKEIRYERGKIYDTNGKILATNARLYNLVLEPKNILQKTQGKGGKEEYRDNKDATLKALKKYMGLDEKAVMAELLKKPDSYYLVYKQGLTYDDISDMKAFMDKALEKKSEAKSEKERALIAQAELITGVQFEEDFRRIYPNDKAACHLLGFISGEGEGLWGIERYYNEQLKGVDGRDFNYLDEDLAVESTRREPIDGDSIVTTIHLDIQKAIEKRRQEFDDKTGSKMTTITVMDPNNGEVLAMTSSYDFDLNDPADKSVLKKLYGTEEIDRFEANQKLVNQGKELKAKKSGEILTLSDAFNSVWKNSVVTDTFEPGSTYKPFTVASVLEEGIYSGTEGFSCPGYLMVRGTKIACSHTHGGLEFKDSIAQSCNVALMNMGLREGKEIFSKYQNLFGFGQKTTIDLPSEANTEDLLHAEDTMSNVDLATNSFGQNFNVTGIQLISAFCSLVNGGYYYRPHVVKQVIGADGNVVKNIGKTLMKTTVSKETSDRLKPLLEETVLTGTGKDAAIKGHTVGGKTGTAEKITPVEKNGKIRYVRNKRDYLVSFIGFTPVENPQYVIYVTIDEPHIDNQAQAGLAVEVEQKCMEDILEIMGQKTKEKAK